MDFDLERERMVEGQLRRRGIRDARVLEAMRAIPREEFVDPAHRGEACWDGPLEIGCGQTVSQPYMTALMAQVLELGGHERVLEVGAGSGYAAAVLGRLAARVVSIELLAELCGLARANLARTKSDGNVLVVCGDGSLGYPPEAPYDAISVAAAAPEIPPALVDQLGDPGRLAIPVGSWEEQDLLVIEKRGASTTTRRAGGCRFVPLRGAGGWR